MKAHKITAGFTLIELSIVLVIIGLIIGGVLVGQMMIRNSTIQKTIKQVEQFNTAVNAFRGKYNCLPGDCRNAYKFGFTTANNSSAGHGVITINGENGNGDGKIYLSATSGGSETYNAFWWMHEAGLVNVPGVQYGDGSAVDFTTISAAIGGGRSTAFGSYMNVWTLNYMDMADPNYLASSGSGNAANNEYFQHPGHYYWLAPQPNVAADVAEAISPADAYAIDAKMDDGFPRSGKVLASGNDFVDYDNSYYNVLPVFNTTNYTESGPIGAAPSPSSCIADNPSGDPAYIYNVTNTLGDNGRDNGSGVGALCTLTVEASF